MEPQILERARHPISRRNIHPNVLKVLYRLIHAGHTAYLVGGGVRDLMLGRKPKDFDVATSAHPHQVRELFRNSRLIGRRFRLVHVFFGPQNIEVATFRRQAEDVVDEGDDLLIRHDNTFGTAEEDAFRRDFTVNALFYNPQSFHVIDYVGGVADLEARLIRTIGDPELRVREDPIRMIRAVRFAAKLGFEIEDGTRRAIQRHHAEITKASPPRLVEEIYRTLGTPAAARALALMEQVGLLAVILPDLSAHLRACAEAPEDTATGRNLAALGAMIEAGGEPSKALVLAAMFLDLHRTPIGPAAARRSPDLLAELRARGFARGDTEHMRLLLDAFDLLVARARRARRLARRPYFAEALRFYDLMARNYGSDPEETARFLSAPAIHHGPAAHPPDGEHAHAAGGERPGGGRRRRRRRRGGRRHRRTRHAHMLASAPDGAEAPGNGAAQGASHHADPSAASAHASPHRHSGDFGRSE